MLKEGKHLNTYQMIYSILLVSGCCLGMQVATAKTVAPDYVMQLQMVPALCALDVKKVKKRKCLDGYAINIAGLYPQTQKQSCYTESSAQLAPLQAKVLARVMPDEVERRTLWRNVGGCLNMTASQYFRLIIRYSEKLEVPTELLGIERNKNIRLTDLRSNFLKLNRGLSQQGIQFECRLFHGEYLLTGAKICYNRKGEYTKCAQNISDRCPQNITIKGSF